MVRSVQHTSFKGWDGEPWWRGWTAGRSRAIVGRCCSRSWNAARRSSSSLPRASRIIAIRELIEHELGHLIAQRVYGLALGYEDLNDHDQLHSDLPVATVVGKSDPGE